MVARAKATFRDATEGAPRMDVLHDCSWPPPSAAFRSATSCRSAAPRAGDREGRREGRR